MVAWRQGVKMETTEVLRVQGRILTNLDIHEPQAHGNFGKSNISNASEDMHTS